MRRRIGNQLVIGLGILAWGKDRALSMKDRLPTRDELIKRGEQERSELKKDVKTRMSRVLSELGLAARADIEELARKTGGLAAKAKTN